MDEQCHSRHDIYNFAIKDLDNRVRVWYNRGVLYRGARRRNFGTFGFDLRQQIGAAFVRRLLGASHKELLWKKANG